MKNKSFRFQTCIRFAMSAALTLMGQFVYSQMITGVWKGKAGNQKLEVKIVQVGDSLHGTSYYYDNPRRYRRYSIRGYFDPNSNEAVWWDDQLIDEQPARTNRGQQALLSRADFNCPGEGRMTLNGKSGKKDDAENDINIKLDKIPETQFRDEWVYIIDNYTIGGADPDLINELITRVDPEPEENPAKPSTPVTKHTPEMVLVPGNSVVVNNPPLAPGLTIEEKFKKRENILVTEIPLSGDSIELRFYDNAEIDGDSISLFLNERLIFSHIRLTGQAYKVHLAVSELQEENRLVMVAENLGTIPPNTSYMVAEVEGKRYEARLESTEGSSAMIRLYKPRKEPQ